MDRISIDMNELTLHQKHVGYLELILGPMFSGKTSQIIDLYKKYHFCDIPVIVVNHGEDTRYDMKKLSNHDKVMIECFQCTSLEDMIRENMDLLVKKFAVVLINEGQFFEDLYDSVNFLVNKLNKHVFVAGLDGDFRAKKFGQILDLIPLCDKVEKCHSICASCKDGTPAIFTERISKHETAQKIIGVDSYQPLCRKCYMENNIIEQSIYLPHDLKRGISKSFDHTSESSGFVSRSL